MYTKAFNADNSQGILRGEIYFADLGNHNVGSVQSGRRPVLIIQNDMGNRYGPTVQVAPLTTKMSKRPLPTHVYVKAGVGNLRCDSLILMEQATTLDKSQLQNKIGMCDDDVMKQVNQAIQVSFGITETN